MEDGEHDGQKHAEHEHGDTTHLQQHKHDGQEHAEYEHGDLTHLNIEAGVNILRFFYKPLNYG